MDEIKIFALNGQLGYGFPADSYKNGIAKNPDVIGVDAGSSDGGPAFLGSGTSLTDEKAVKRDLEFVLADAVNRKIPFIIGSAGTSGGEPHIAREVRLIKELAKEHDLHFKMAIIHSEVPKEYIKKKLKEGKVHPLGDFVPELTEETIDNAVRIVGQMGVTPFIKALDAGADVIVGGRSCDTAIYACLPIKLGFSPALSFHAAKVIECGAYCCTPGEGADGMFATIRNNDFILESVNKDRNVSPVSVAAHTLYEQGHPSVFYEPDGAVICTDCEFEQYENDPKKVRVEGTKFDPAKGKWTIKLEGAVLEGYRTISIAGIRDPYMIKHIDEVIAGVTKNTETTMGSGKDVGYTLNFRVYGKNAVMGDLEYVPCTSSELGVIIDVVAKDQKTANAICAITRSFLLHYPYPERRTTGGNIAIPFSPSDIPMGPVYKFGIYHLIDVDDPNELFPIEEVEV